MATELHTRQIKNALRWFSNLTEKEHIGVKNKFENTINKQVYQLTVEDICEIYFGFFGMT